MFNKNSPSYKINYLKMNDIDKKIKISMKKKYNIYIEITIHK